jgi:hypothetical protein
LRIRPNLLFVSALLSSAMQASGQDVRDLHTAVLRDTAVLQLGLDGCVRVHHVWKRQIMAAHQAAALPVEDRSARILELVYRPFASFWSGYVGNEAAFIRMNGRINLAADPRSRVPIDADIGALMLDATRREIEASGKRACADWYLLYGPGFTNLGGLSTGAMLIDFLGLPRTNPVEDVRLTLPHELNHISFGAGHRSDPDAGTLLSSVIAEGLGSWYADLFWGDRVTPAQALGYTEPEWQWALAHEKELWAAAEPLLSSKERATLDRFRSARARVIPEGPAKVGYFLGYRIVDAYVKRHGESAWRALFDLPIAQILRDSGYRP